MTARTILARKLRISDMTTTDANDGATTGGSITNPESAAANSAPLVGTIGSSTSATPTTTTMQTPAQNSIENRIHQGQILIDAILQNTKAWATKQIFPALSATLVTTGDNPSTTEYGLDYGLPEHDIDEPLLTRFEAEMPPLEVPLQKTVDGYYMTGQLIFGPDLAVDNGVTFTAFQLGALLLKALLSKSREGAFALQLLQIAAITAAQIMREGLPATSGDQAGEQIEADSNASGEQDRTRAALRAAGLPVVNRYTDLPGVRLDPKQMDCEPEDDFLISLFAGKVEPLPSDDPESIEDCLNGPEDRRIAIETIKAARANEYARRRLFYEMVRDFVNDRATWTALDTPAPDYEALLQRQESQHSQASPVSEPDRAERLFQHAEALLQEVRGVYETGPAGGDVLESIWNSFWNANSDGDPSGQPLPLSEQCENGICAEVFARSVYPAEVFAEADGTIPPVDPDMDRSGIPQDAFRLGVPYMKASFGRGPGVRTFLRLAAVVAMRSMDNCSD